MGERSRNIGSEAERKAWKFLRNLGYKILDTNIEEYDIDCLAEFPPRIGKYMPAKPRYAPEGLTAFEVTEEPLRTTKIDSFRNKILRYNSENTQDRIGGGILLVDQRIPIGMMKYMKDQNIWGWGSSRLRFYQEKMRTFNAWKDTYGQTSEIPLDEEVSYLRCSTPPPTKLDKLLYVALFFDDSFHRLSARRVTETMTRIREDCILPILNANIVPINIHFECHSIGGIGDLEEDFHKHIVEEWRKDRINVKPAMNPFRDYRTFATMG